MSGLKALWFLRWTHFRRRTLRRAGNLTVYLQWQAVVIYLYAGAAFLGGPLYYLFVPVLIPPEIRAMLGVLLFALVCMLLAWAAYRSLFAAADGFPGSVPVADIQFVLPTPVSRAAFLADRLLWGMLQAMGEGLALMPVSWVLGRAFFPHWGWAEAVSAGALFTAGAIGTQATGLFLYGLPLPLVTALRAVRAGLWGLLGLAGIVLAVLSRVLGGRLPAPATPAPAPGALAALGAALPAAHLVHALLPWAALWAVVAAALTLWLSRPQPVLVAEDAQQAERRRAARLSGQRQGESQKRGLARTSLERGWGQGWRAVAWRQLAAYRHMALSAWPPKLLGLLAVMGAPAFFRLAPSGPAGSLVVLAPAMIGISVAAGLIGTWRLEVQEGWTRRLMPVRLDHLIQGAAVWPAGAVGAAGALGVLLYGLKGGLSAADSLAGAVLALAGGVLVALLALHEEWTAAASLTGPAEGRQTGKLFSILLCGAPALLASALARGGASLVFVFVLMAALVLLEALGVGFYLSFRLATEKR